MMLAGVVLAGGRSSRMGRDKALLACGGRILLEHAVATLREAGAAQVLVSGERPGGIADRVPGLGPLGGLDACLPRLGDGPLVVVPVDMPGLEAPLLRRLADAAALVRSATYEGHPLPWAFQVDAASRAAVAEIVLRDGAERSLRALQSRLRTVGLAVPEGAGGLLDNVNTPEDWERFAS